MVQLSKKEVEIMWKYECKRHLTYIAVGMLIGALIFGVLGWQKEAVLAIFENTVNTNPMLEGVVDVKLLTENPITPYFFGAFSVGALVNGMMLVFAIIRHFNISFFVVFLILMIFPSLISSIGFLTLLPVIVVCIYGWLTVPNRKERKNLEHDSATTVKEAERVYRLHHAYDEKNEALGNRAWKIMLRVNILYVVGIVGLFLILLYVADFTVVMLAGIIFMVLFYQLTKYKNAALQPIVSLLYDQCDPEACAVAIFALARKAHKKKTFPLTQQLAQCMIYLNDPYLAIDVLSTSPASRNGIVYPYYTLMGYAYYQLGDRSMVTHQLNECENSGGKANKTGPMGVFRQQAIAGLENKLNLLNEQFEPARTYYASALEQGGMVFQHVDTHYYLGLIAFVQRDFREAQEHFRFVSEHGNKMYFKQKADTFLDTIDSLQLD